jgi:integrase
MAEYYSAYAPFLRDYIEFKRTLGYKYQIEYAFSVFDRFMDEHDEHNIGLSRRICDLWAAKRPNESEKTRYRRVNNVRNFSAYLNGIGYPSYIPRQTKMPHNTFTPYIFTKEELQKFFTACDNLGHTRRSKYARLAPALFRTIYGCGLRLNEALSIKYRDVDLDAKSILIRDSKNGEDRLLPLSESLAAVLLAYRETWEWDATPEDYFFTGQLSLRCNGDTSYSWFREILYKAGISHGGKGAGPRIHDLRHSFSVHTLAAMAESGLDLYYCLPILSKYLGHKSLEATEQYVRLTEDMYPGIMEEMNKLCAYIFPEANHETH